MRYWEFKEAVEKKIVAVMPGGFHPFHPGHKSLYDWATNTFGKENVYVAATNDTSTRPFPFDVKQKLAGMAGVPGDKFIQIKSPFNALSYASIIGNPNSTSLIFIRSEKDQGSHPLPDQIRKSDGMMGYLVSYKGKDQLETADAHAHIAYGPTIDFDFSGMSIKSATELRNTWPTMSEEDKLKAAELMYGAGAQEAVMLLDQALGGPIGESLNEVENMPVAQKIEPIKMSNPPKAPDATIPRTRDGYTTDDGTTYKQDKYDENLMHVSNGGGTYTFDGSRLIKWTTPKIQGYRQIHDFVRKTIKVDADTTVQSPEGADVLVSTKAVYDLEGNLQNGAELGFSAGGLNVGVSSDKFSMDYVVSDNLSMHISATKGTASDKEMQNIQAMAQDAKGIKGGTQPLQNLAKFVQSVGQNVTFKSPADGQAIPFRQGMEMLGQAGA